MHSTNTTTVRWSAQRFMSVIAVVFAVQIGLLFLLGDGISKSKQVTRDGIQFGFVATELKETEIFRHLLATDPTLFVVASDRDFSGEAWLKKRVASYAPAEWDEPPEWLPMDVQSLGDSFVRSVRFNDSKKFEVAQELELNDPLRPLTSVKQRSFMKVEGELGKRLVGKPSVPTLEHSEPLEDTVVQIAVVGSGAVVSARILSPRTGAPGSLTLANQKALEICNALRFQPDNRQRNTEIVRGNVIFRWQTVPASPRNPESSP